MAKKMILAGTAFVLIFATALPAYAQSPTPGVNPGFISEITNFFSSFFHHQTGTTGQTQSQNVPNNPAPSGQTSPSGASQPKPSGMPDFQSMQERRLSYLVQQGKITQAQEQAIVTELTTVQNELTSWAQSQGIDPSYVLGGTFNSGFGGSGSRFGTQNVSNQSQGTNLQYHNPVMQSGHGFQGGGQNGQPPQQGQGQ